MARTNIRIPYNIQFDQLESTVTNILTNSGYEERNYNGEIVWKKGRGVLSAMKFIKLEYEENVLIVYGWIQVGLGSVSGKEKELSGVYAAVPKKKVLKVISKIQESIQNLNECAESRITSTGVTDFVSVPKLSSPEMSMKCLKCGEVIYPNAKYCLECGTKVEILAENETICPYCKTNVRKGKFCIECGQNLQAECPNCGYEIIPNSKYCLECGMKFEKNTLSSASSLI